jgi:mono/diheme cytochrome c family protein
MLRPTLKTNVLVMGGLISVIYFVGCSAQRKPLPFERTIANMAKDVVIPMEAHNVKSPIPPGEAAIHAGEQIYLRDCALCHGADGHGYTNLGRHMFPPAMDLTSPHVQHWTDADLYWIIQNGIGLTGMPSWKTTLSSDDIWRVTQFIHALPELDAQQASAGAAQSSVRREPGQRQKLIAYGRTLYHQEGCFMCHQLDGQGGKVGPDLSNEGARGRTDAWLIGHFKDPSAYTPGSIMPAFKNLTQTQLQALTAFLQSQRQKQK